jgi:hypothetical protein
MSDPSTLYQFDAKSITEILNEFGCNITVKEIKQPTVKINFKSFFLLLNKIVLFLA